MEFQENCNMSLYLEAKKVINLNNWSANLKKHILNEVVHRLEIGQMRKTKTGWVWLAYNVSDVSDIVQNVYDIDSFN
jgi:hypothetical protein